MNSAEMPSGVQTRSNSASATVPQFWIIPPGTTSISFSVTYGVVRSNTPVVITATNLYDAKKVMAYITIKP